MAYEEYLDLYLLAQDNPNAAYYVVSFDVINSKQLSLEKRTILQENIGIIIKSIYNKLLEKQKELNIQTVITDERFIRPWDSRTYHWNGTYVDPFVFGDCFSFTVLRNTVTKDEIVKWVYDYKQELNMEEDFHIADGYYETNDFAEGNSLFYRGYCLQTLESLYKPQIQKELKKIKSKKI